MCSFFLVNWLNFSNTEQISKEVPRFFFCFSFNKLLDTEVIEGKASPLKPKEEILFKFSKLSFEAVCLFRASPSSLELIPSPLSETIISVLPPSLIKIFISLALASMYSQ